MECIHHNGTCCPCLVPTYCSAQAVHAIELVRCGGAAVLAAWWLVRVCVFWEGLFAGLVLLGVGRMGCYGWCAKAAGPAASGAARVAVAAAACGSGAHECEILCPAT
jgi:hypothetical protein